MPISQRSIKDYHRKIAPEEEGDEAEGKKKLLFEIISEIFPLIIFFIIIILSLRPTSEIIIQSVYILTWSGDLMLTVHVETFDRGGKVRIFRTGI